jgi:predicted Ser/Thr protein kinase
MLKIASRYVVLRDGLRPASLAPLYALGRDEVGADIDLLVEDRADAAFLLNAAPTGGAKTTNYHAFVGGVEIKLDIYEICDGSFDSRWAQAMLDGRIIANDVAIPDPINEFYSLLYHCLLRKTFIKLSHMNRLLTLSKLMGKPMTWEHLINRPNAIAMLTQFMSRKRYSFTKPNYSNAETNENWAKEVPVTKEVTNSIIGSLSKSPAHSSKQNDYFLRQIWRTRWFNGDDVAVKLVRTTDEKVSGRLFREGEFLKAMGGVFSPKLYFEVTGRTQYFLVSEWIEGRTLDDLLTAPEFSGNWRRIREHLQSLFSAIQSTGIVHNDIRGTNIIIRDNDARILDFGNSYWLKDPLDQILPTRDDKEAIDDLLRAVDREISSNVGKTI